MTEVLDQQRFVTVVAPTQHGQMGEVLSALYFNLLMYRAFEQFGRRGGAPLMLVMDEAAQLKDQIDFGRVLSTARGAGVMMVLAVQDALQFTDDNERSTLFANCATVVEFPGVSHGSADILVKRLGEHQVQTSSVTRTPNPRSGRPELAPSIGTQAAHLLGHREIMAPPFNGRQPWCTPAICGPARFSSTWRNDRGRCRSRACGQARTGRCSTQRPC